MLWPFKKHKAPAAQKPKARPSSFPAGSSDHGSGYRQLMSIEVREKHTSKSASASSAATNVSTLSSVDDIVRCVSEANTASLQRSAGRGGLVANESASASDLKGNKSVVIQRCYCCNSKFQVSESSVHLLCSLCDTLNDIPGKNTPPVAQSPVPNMNLDLLKDIVQAAVATDEFVELEKHLSSMFCDIPRINQLFLLRPDKPTKISYSRPNLDFEQLKSFYSILHEESGSEKPLQIFSEILLSLLKHPRVQFSTPGDLSFLLICMDLPIFRGGTLFSSASRNVKISSSSNEPDELNASNIGIEIIERVSGFLINATPDCRHYLLNWILRYPLPKFQQKVELLNACIANRLTYHYQLRYGKRRKTSRHRHHSSESFVGPSTTNSASSNQPSVAARRGPNYDRDRVHGRSQPSLQALMQHTPPPGGQYSAHSRQKKRRGRPLIKTDMYTTDWKIEAFVRLMAIFYNANASSRHQLPVSTFYNTMVDFTDILGDFDGWQKASIGSLYGGDSLRGPNLPSKSAVTTEKRKSIMALSGEAYTAAIGDEIIDGVSYTASGGGRNGPYSQFLLFTGSGKPLPQFVFCQYPFILSMGSKTEILEHDALRQMECEAQDAFFDSLINKRSISPYLMIRVDRNNLLQESLAVLESNESNFKKAIRVEFVDEPGVDAGGLKKEWFLLLTRALFDPNAGYFSEEEDSGKIWFNKDPSHAPKYYKLSGLVVGLALYNSTIIDVNLPTVLFKKLLGCGYNLDDLVSLFPTYGRGLKNMLSYKGDDFEDTFSLDFTICVKDAQGKMSVVELAPEGSSIPVTKENRQDYVRKIMSYYLDSSVRRQFEAFKQGFFMVAGGNALSLFRPEEIELLVRGSPEPIDVDALRSVTKYQHWSTTTHEADQDPVVRWFWDFFKKLGHDDQRRLLTFVTGSDRIPATGITNMPFRITRLGGDSERLPTAHTCFNQLCLYAYSSREKFNRKLLLAMRESQGFGIK